MRFFKSLEGLAEDEKVSFIGEGAYQFYLVSQMLKKIKQLSYKELMKSNCHYTAEIKSLLIEVKRFIDIEDFDGFEPRFNFTDGDINSGFNYVAYRLSSVYLDYFDYMWLSLGIPKILDDMKVLLKIRVRRFELQEEFEIIMGDLVDMTDEHIKDNDAENIKSAAELFRSMYGVESVEDIPHIINQHIIIESKDRAVFTKCRTYAYPDSLAVGVELIKEDDYENKTL